MQTGGICLPNEGKVVVPALLVIFFNFILFPGRLAALYNAVDSIQKYKWYWFESYVGGIKNASSG